MESTLAPIRVLIADDHEVVREGIRRILEREPGFEIVGEASSGDQALELLQRARPDVALLDVTMPGPDGLEVTARVRQLVPECRVLILSMHDDAIHVMKSVRAGAHGYILKDSAATELREALRRVHAGDNCYSPAVASKLGTAARDELEAEQRRNDLELLTGREREVLLGIVRGQTNKDIAASLGISHRTVETYRESLMRKLRIHTVAGLTRFAIEVGILER